MPRTRLLPPLVAAMLMAAAGTLSADFRPASRLAWAFDFPFNSERAGNTLFVAGDFNAAAPVGNLSPYLVELQTDGSATPSRAVPAPTDAVRVVLADGSGGYFVGGWFPSIGGVAQAALAHIRPDGTIDPAFAPVVAPVGRSSASVSALALAGDVLYVGGHFGQINGIDRHGAAALNRTTGAVLAWDPGLPIGSEASALVVSGSTAYVAAGTVHAVNAVTGAPVAGFTVTATSVTAMSLGGSTLYLGGFFTTVNGAARLGLAAVDAATGAVRPLTADLNGGGWVAALALDGATLYVGGDFESLGGQPRLSLGAVDVSSGTVAAFAPEVNGRVFAVHVQGPAVYVGGEFSHAGGQPRANIAAVSKGGVAQPWNPGLSSTVSSVTASGGVVMAGGFFARFGAVPRDGLAAVDLVTGELTSFAPSIAWNGAGIVVVNGLSVAGHTLYIGGQFSRVNGEARQRLAALDIKTGTLLPWDPGANHFVQSIRTAGGAVYLAGQFTSIAGVARHSLAALDAVSGADLGWDAEVVGQVSELEVDENTLYAAGSFSHMGGQPRANVGAFALGTRTLTPFDPGVTGPGAYVSAVSTVGNALYLAGSFTGVGGQPRTSAAAVDRTTGAALPFAPVISADGFVADIDVAGGAAYLAGFLATVNGEARSSDAAVDAATGLITLPFDPAFGGREASSVHVRADPDLLFSGTFATDGSYLRSGLFPSTAMGGVPGRPSAPVPVVTGGSALEMHWRTSPIGGEPTGYVVEAGTTPGSSNLGTLPTAGPAFSFAGVPPGRYFLRVRALNAVGSSPASPEIAVVFGNGSCGSVPGPVTVDAAISGTAVTLTWPDAVGASGTYILAAGSGPGQSSIATLDLGPLRQFVTDAPPGVYYVRVSADSPCGLGAPGPDTVIAVGGAQPLAAPSARWEIDGSTVTINWTAVPGAAGYRLEAGSGPLLANIVTTATTTTSLVATGVPPGTYYVRVRAISAGGTAESNELVVMVPQARPTGG